MLEQLALNTLTKLDGGKIGEALRAHLNRAANDCMDRPGDGKARTVVLKITLTPVMDDGLDCSEVKGQFNITSKVPDHKTKLLSFGARRGGMLVFNPDSPTDINQGTLLDDDENAQG